MNITLKTEVSAFQIRFYYMRLLYIFEIIKKPTINVKDHYLAPPKEIFLYSAVTAGSVTKGQPIEILKYFRIYGVLLGTLYGPLFLEHQLGLFGFS